MTLSIQPTETELASTEVESGEEQLLSEAFMIGDAVEELQCAYHEKPLQPSDQQAMKELADSINDARGRIYELAERLKGRSS